MIKISLDSRLKAIHFLFAQWTDHGQITAGNDSPFLVNEHKHAHALVLTYTNAHTSTIQSVAFRLFSTLCRFRLKGNKLLRKTSICCLCDGRTHTHTHTSHTHTHTHTHTRHTHTHTHGQRRTVLSVSHSALRWLLG